MTWIWWDRIIWRISVNYLWWPFGSVLLGRFWVKLWCFNTAWAPRLEDPNLKRDQDSTKDDLHSGVTMLFLQKLYIETMVMENIFDAFDRLNFIIIIIILTGLFVGWILLYAAWCCCYCIISMLIKSLSLLSIISLLHIFFYFSFFLLHLLCVYI